MSAEYNRLTGYPEVPKEALYHRTRWEDGSLQNGISKHKESKINTREIFARGNETSVLEELDFIRRIRL